MKKQGRGIAGCMYSLTVMNAPNPCSAYVQMREDGSVNVQTGACDIGQGSNTVLAMMVAESLTVPFEKVSVYSADTSATPYDFGTLSSRVTYTGGRAVLAACEQVKGVLLEAAAKQLKTRPDRLSFKAGMIVDKYDAQKQLPVAAAAAISQFVHRKLPMGMGEFYPFNVPVDAQGHGEPADSYYYHATAVDVEVDTDTGVVEVKKLYTAVDCGKALNPMIVEGQLEGGAMQAVGWALREDMYPYGTGAEAESPDFNPNFRPINISDYAIATTLDTPEIHGAIVETHEGEGPFGAKAAGEICANSAAPAIVNAIHDAVGIWISDLPATPEKVLKLLRDQQS
ncbi:MAG: molybdenum hydroxylase family protein, large subunit [Holophagaceae bacterium]|nr:molybdenum hydroxylase family protein, large subunit [Holophagaceae bacterium]